MTGECNPKEWICDVLRGGSERWLGGCPRAAGIVLLPKRRAAAPSGLGCAVRGPSVCDRCRSGEGGGLPEEKDCREVGAPGAVVSLHIAS